MTAKIIYFSYYISHTIIHLLSDGGKKRVPALILTQGHLTNKGGSANLP